MSTVVANGVAVKYRDVPDRPGYRVGSDGSVWSCHQVGGIGGGRMTDEWHRLNPYMGPTGYLTVGMRCGNRPSVPHKVHRLVLLAFVGTPPAGHVGCHNNGDKLDNRLANLRWDSRQSNEHDKARHGTKPLGEKVGGSKLTEEQVAEIRRLYVPRTPGRSQYALAARFGVNQCTVSMIVRGKNWGHVQDTQTEGA